LSSKLVVATRSYDKDLLTRLGLLDNIHRLFASMGQFLEIRDHTYRDLILKFLSTLHVEMTSGPHCQEGYISFYLNRDFYKLNLSAFNSILAFPPSMDLPSCHVPNTLTQMLFGMDFLGIISLIQVILKAPLLKILVFEWPKDYLWFVC